MQEMDWSRRFYWLAIVGLFTEGACAAGSEAQVRVRVAITIEVAPQEPYVRAMIAEADAIWRPHNVAVVLSSGNDIGPGDVPVALTLMPVAEAVATARRAGSRAVHAGDHLGTVRLDDNGVPAPLITVDPTAVRALLMEAVGWPAAFSEGHVGRALGRVLAHEIGHYVLAFPAHTRTGLMRASFSGQQLSEFGRHSFDLGHAVLPRLRERLALMPGPRDAVSAGRQ